MSDPKNAPASKTAESAPTKLRIKNPGPNPRHYFRGSGGLFAPGEVREVDAPDALADVQRSIAKKHLHPEPYTVDVMVDGKKTKTKVPADILLVGADVEEITAAQLFEIERKKLDDDVAA